MTWTGFSGAEINGFLGEPTRLVMKPEKPDFFLSTPGILGSLPESPEKRFEEGALSILGTVVFSPTTTWREAPGPVDEKLDV